MPCYLKDRLLKGLVDEAAAKRKAKVADLSKAERALVSKEAALKLLRDRKITPAYYAHLVAEIDGCETHYHAHVHREVA